MAERLAVDGDELRRFMRLLDDSAASLGRLRKALHDATVTGLGSDELDDACDAFQSDWRYGAGRIGEQVEELSGIVGKGEASYAEVDRALEEALRGAASRGGGGRS
jgi:hypothetical protein